MTRKLLHKNILIILCSAILFISGGGQVFADQNSLAYTDEASLDRETRDYFSDINQTVKIQSTTISGDDSYIEIDGNNPLREEFKNATIKIELVHQRTKGVIWSNSKKMVLKPSSNFSKKFALPDSYGKVHPGKYDLITTISIKGHSNFNDKQIQEHIVEDKNVARQALESIILIGTLILLLTLLIQKRKADKQTKKR